MTEFCQPLPGNLVAEMLQLFARAICDRPGETVAQCEGRTNHMVHSVLGMAPRDGMELMLAGLAIGHFNLIMDSMRDVFQGQLADQLKAKTKLTVVTLGRAMLEMIKEMRDEKCRPAARSAGQAHPDVSVATPAEATPEDPPRAAQEPDSVPADIAAAGSAAVTQDTASRQVQTSMSDPVSVQDKVPGVAPPAARQSVSGDRPMAARSPDLPPPADAEEAAIHARFTANEALLAAANESIAEAWRDHRAQVAAASGD